MTVSADSEETEEKYSVWPIISVQLCLDGIVDELVDHHLVVCCPFQVSVLFYVILPRLRGCAVADLWGHRRVHFAC